MRGCFTLLNNVSHTMVRVSHCAKPECPGARKCVRCRRLQERMRYHRDPEVRRKKKARSVAGYYRRRGRLVAQLCRECGEPAQMHHPDYDKALVVEWLCEKCHRQVHRIDRFLGIAH